MPRGQRSVKTTFQKAQPTKRRRAGRPKGSKSLVKTLKRTVRETSDIEEFLNENNGNAPWLKLIEQYQSECDHALWPQKALATGGQSDTAYTIAKCTGCWWVRRIESRIP